MRMWITGLYGKCYIVSTQFYYIVRGAESVFLPLNINAIYAHGTNIREWERKHIMKDNIYTNPLLNLSISLKFYNMQKF